MFYYSEDIIHLSRHVPNFFKPGYMERYLEQVVYTINTFPHLLSDYPQYRYDYLETLYFLKQQSCLINARYFSDLIDLKMPHFLLWGSFLLLIKKNLHHEDKKWCIDLIEKQQDVIQNSLVMMVHDYLSGIEHPFNQTIQQNARHVSHILHLMQNMEVPIRLAPTEQEMKTLKSLFEERKNLVQISYKESGSEKARAVLEQFNQQYFSKIIHLPDYQQWLKIINYPKPLFIYT